METPPLRPELQEIVEEILDLRALTATTGYMTFKSQKVLLDKLSIKDQAAVGRALKEKEQTK